jgi:hypothetical protein
VVVARGVLVIALLLGLASLPRVEREVRESAAARMEVSHGVPVLPGMPAGMEELIATVRDRVPRRTPVRIVTTAGTCRRIPVVEGQGAVYWLQYQLLPRPISCDSRAPWTIYLKSQAPPGAEVVFARPELTLARR